MEHDALSEVTMTGAVAQGVDVPCHYLAMGRAVGGGGGGAGIGQTMSIKILSPAPSLQIMMIVNTASLR